MNNHIATWYLFSLYNTVLAFREITQIVYLKHTERLIRFVKKSSGWCLYQNPMAHSCSHLCKRKKVKLETLNSLLFLPLDINIPTQAQNPNRYCGNTVSLQFNSFLRSLYLSGRWIFITESTPLLQNINLPSEFIKVSFLTSNQHMKGVLPVTRN